MRDLRLGMQVLVARPNGSLAFEEVFMFGHKDPHAQVPTACLPACLLACLCRISVMCRRRQYTCVGNTWPCRQLLIRSVSAIVPQAEFVILSTTSGARIMASPGHYMLAVTAETLSAISHTTSLSFATHTQLRTARSVRLGDKMWVVEPEAQAELRTPVAANQTCAALTNLRPEEVRSGRRHPVRCCAMAFF